MWNKQLPTRIGLWVVVALALPLLGALVIPRFPPGKPPEETVIATLRVLAKEQSMARPVSTPAPTAETTPSPSIEVPDGSRYAYRLQRTATGLRVHAWPLTFDSSAPYLFFLDEDGSIWTGRNPSGSHVGLDRPPELDAGVAATDAPHESLSGRSREDRYGRRWLRE
ncbi:MAG: hypothetical protein JNL90_12245 [Planctomycetes bacterium]|nr:hypothetical protein [Planctomycetota bacterium]